MLVRAEISMRLLIPTEKLGPVVFNWNILPVSLSLPPSQPSGKSMSMDIRTWIPSSRRQPGLLGSRYISLKEIMQQQCQVTAAASRKQQGHAQEHLAHSSPSVFFILESLKVKLWRAQFFPHEFGGHLSLEKKVGNVERKSLCKWLALQQTIINILTVIRMKNYNLTSIDQATAIN